MVTKRVSLAASLVAIACVCTLIAPASAFAAVELGGRIGLHAGSITPPEPGTIALQPAGWHSDDYDPSYGDISYVATGPWSPDGSLTWAVSSPDNNARRVRVKDLGGLYLPQWIGDSAWCANATEALAPDADTTLTVGAKVYRYYGMNRYWTNWEVGGTFFPGLVSGYTARQAVCMEGDSDIGAPLIVASGEKYPDALAAAALASASGGRLVLTRRDALPADVVNSAWATPDGWASGGLGSFAFADDFVVHQSRRKVYILGGTGAVGKPVEDWFANREASIVRLAGADRYGTAAAVADEVVALTGTTTVNPVVVAGESFADALGGAALSAARKQPLLLVGPDYVPACVTAFYAAHAATDSVVLGGSAVMSDSVVAQLKPAVRIAGADRYDTCAQSVTYGLDQGWFKPSHVAIVTGANFPDGLGAGAALGRLGWPTLLTYRDTLPTATADVLADNDVVRVSVLGGTGVVSAEVATAAKALLK